MHRKHHRKPARKYESVAAKLKSGKSRAQVTAEHRAARKKDRTKQVQRQLDRMRGEGRV